MRDERQFVRDERQFARGDGVSRERRTLGPPYVYMCVCVYICVFVCVSSKNTAVCCLTARKSPRNSSLPLGLAIYILRKMPRKSEESSVECYGHVFLIAAQPRGVSL